MSCVPFWLPRPLLAPPFQLSGGVRSLCAPVDNLHSNWAYMLMTSVACKANDSSLDELERLHTGFLSTLQNSEPLTADR